MIGTVRTAMTGVPFEPDAQSTADSAHGAANDDGLASQLRPESAEAERSVWDRVQELQRAINARDEFIATVAHELRNPIAPLTLQVRLALNKVERLTAEGEPIAADWVQSQLRGIERRFDRLLETLDRLLDMSRLSTGRIDLQLEPVTLETIVRDIAASFEPELAVARCPLTIQVQNDTTGIWDRLRIEQICRNLLSNALRFGAGAPIAITLDGDDEHVTLEVRDRGVGIPHDQQARVFERFERGAQRSGGFGVGLWLVRNICIAMGGTVTLHSEPGQGACFMVRLPRQPGRSSLG